MLSRRLLAAGAAVSPAILARAARGKTQHAETKIYRIKRAKDLRIAALPGETPNINKDIETVEWSGMSN
jgi:hypothetical protein